MRLIAELLMFNTFPLNRTHLPYLSHRTIAIYMDTESAMAFALTKPSYTLPKAMVANAIAPTKLQWKKTTLLEKKNLNYINIRVYKAVTNENTPLWNSIQTHIFIIYLHFQCRLNVYPFYCFGPPTSDFSGMLLN